MRLALALLAVSTPAFADCPTNVRDLPATGALASETRRLQTEMGERVQEAPPMIEAELAAAGAVRGEADVVSPTGAASGQFLVRRGGLTACASADVVDLAEGAAHLTAAGQVPLLIAGLGLGVAIDRDIRLPLSSRREFFRSPLDRIAGQFSVSFVDFDLVDKENHLRILVMPTTIEKAMTTQGEQLRRTTRLETAVMRFIASGPGGNGEFGVFGIQSETIDNSAGYIQKGWIEISILSLATQGKNWDVGLDGGFIALDDVDVNCMTQHCTRGFYDLSMRRRIGAHSVEAHVERAAYLGTDDVVAFEDRATTTYAYSDDHRTISTSAFVARSSPWLTKGYMRNIGTRVGYAQQLGHHMSALVDGELVRSEDDDLAARGVVSLAYQRKLLRY